MLRFVDMVRKMMHLKNKLLLCVTGVTILFSGCAKPDGGFAPDMSTVVVDVPLDADNSGFNFKYGSEVLIASGWSVSMDQSDPVQNQIIANGWEVEIKYE